MISTQLNKKVSVVIPCYNQGKYLYESVSSALLAYKGPLEIIIVDDGSTDPKTSYYLHEVGLLSDCIQVVRQSNCGLSGARNVGIEKAKGEYIQFLDADDMLIPGKLDAQVAHMIVARDLDISVTDFLLCDETSSNFCKSYKSFADFNFSLEDFLYRWERGFSVPVHCGLFRRSLFDSVRFDIEAYAKEDWIIWITLVLRGARIGYFPGHYAIYRQHEASMRRTYINMGKSWLKAAIKVDAMLECSHPLFFESAVSWFDQCYRAHPLYRKEIAALQDGCRNEEIMREPMEDNEDLIQVDALVASLAPLDKKLDPPLISVVVPIYNHYHHLVKCLKSLAEQGDISIELICVDDASTDVRVRRLCNALVDRLDRLKIICHTENLGISLSQNEAVELARGEYIAFLDCDDMLPKGALERVAYEIRRKQDIDYWFTDRLEVDEDDRTIRHAIYGGYDNIKFHGEQQIAKDMLDGMVASHLKVIKRLVYLAIGGCNDAYSGIQDWELALRIADQNGKFGYIQEPLYIHRIHTKSVTRSNSVEQLRKTNIVRRIFAQKRFRGRSFPVYNKKQLVDLISSKSSLIRVFNSEKRIPTLDDLKCAWNEKKLCVMNLQGEMSLSVINFVREFNSYFDLVFWNDPATAGALIGYLWGKPGDAILWVCDKNMGK